MSAAMIFAIAAFVCVVLPLAISALLYRRRGIGMAWRHADRSSAGLLPTGPGATIRILAARTVQWRGIFACHCWIVFREEAAMGFTRYDYTAWGDPIRLNGFEPDGRWFGHLPQLVFAADGAAAARLIPDVRKAIAGYAHRTQGDYRAWPGPNSNSFVTAIIDAVPGLDAVLPPHAIGKDYPYDGRWIRRTRSGLRLMLGGYAGLTLGWREGLEVNLLGLVVGFDLRYPALKLPGLGRLGLSPQSRAKTDALSFHQRTRPTSPR